ncbi:MAG: HAMP domain-containing histidine kinase [Planctomycetes bacterium]|nr:HAMP domain-containing histidine kinase [Planctomycetota bacterium]MCB9886783.1 HAMP domain-containing histidine kinase [Planctomycetota bacterium]
MSIRNVTWASASAGASALLTVALGAPAWAVAITVGGAAGLAAQAAARASDRELHNELRRRDEQLACTAHELRTPLSSVVTVLEMLREGYARDSTETAEFLDLATFAANHLGLLVNDVLDDAALVAGRLQLQRAPMRVTDLVRETTHLMDLQARARRIALHIESEDEDLHALTDARRFRQILFNLVGNSMKFSAPGDAVRIEVEGTPSVVRIEIVDQGPGVPMRLRDQLFTAFGNGDAGIGASESTGLGLHVCRRLVEHMGGRIGFRPGPERGSTFWFELPRVPAPAQAVVAPELAAAR